jgi:hypothetical protein
VKKEKKSEARLWKLPKSSPKKICVCVCVCGWVGRWGMAYYTIFAMGPFVSSYATAHKFLPLDPILNQMILVHILTLYFIKTYF